MTFEEFLIHADIKQFKKCKFGECYPNSHSDIICNFEEIIPKIESVLKKVLVFTFDNQFGIYYFSSYDKNIFNQYRIKITETGVKNEHNQSRKYRSI